MSAPSGIGTAASALALSVASVAGQYLGDAHFAEAAFGAGLAATIAAPLGNQLWGRIKSHFASSEQLTDTLHNEHLALAAEDALRHAILSAGQPVRDAGADLSDSTLAQLADAASAHWRDLHLARDPSVAGFDSRQLAERVVEHLTSDAPEPRILLPAWKAILQDAAAKAQLTLGLDHPAWNALAGHVTREYSARLYNAFKSDLRAGGDGGPAFAGIVLRLLSDLHRSVRDLSEGRAPGGSDDNPSAAELKPLIRRLRRIADGIQHDTKGLLTRFDATTRTALAEFIEPLHENVRAVRKDQRKQWKATLAVLVLIAVVLASIWWAKRESHMDSADLHQEQKQIIPAIAASTARQTEEITAMVQRKLDEQAASFEVMLAKATTPEARADAEGELKSIDSQKSRAPAAAADIAIRATGNSLSTEMAAILADKGVDAALAHYEEHKAQNAAQAVLDLRRQRDPDLTAAKLMETSGRKDEARAAYRELLALDPTWPAALEGYAWLLHDKSEKSLANGKVADALAEAHQCLERAVQFYELNQPNVRSRILLAHSHDQMGDALEARKGGGDSRTALGHYKRALDERYALINSSQNYAEAAHEWAISLDKFVPYCIALGDIAEAEDYLKKASGIMELWLQAKPNSIKAKHDYCMSLGKLGDFYRDRMETGDADKSAEFYLRCSTVFEEIVSSRANWSMALTAC